MDDFLHILVRYIYFSHSVFFYKPEQGSVKLFHN